MRGIAAVHAFADADVRRDALDRLMPRLAHRGPDGGGVQADERTALGHWRLSILDPTDAGAKPMERHGTWVVHTARSTTTARSPDCDESSRRAGAS